MKKAQCSECGRAGGYALYCMRCAEEMLKQSEQRPVAWIPHQDLADMRAHYLLGAKDYSLNIGLVKKDGDVPIYTAPQQRPWVGLTQDELTIICDSMKTWSSFTVTDVYFAIQEKLREKNK